MQALGFTEFILKIFSRCNLNCDYCYVYNMADTTWRERSVIMSPATLKRFAQVLGAHARKHELKQVVVTLHGGEPLLATPAYLRFLSTEIRAALPSYTQLKLQAQSNGTT